MSFAPRWFAFGLGLLCTFLAEGGTRVALAQAPADEKLFAELDINEDGRLSGTELKTVARYDANGDGRVTKAEFLVGRKADAAPRPQPMPVQPVRPGPPVRPVDPKQAEWNRKLVKQFETGQRWAILIGVTDYEHIKPLPTADTTKMLSEVLEKHGGYTRSHMLLLTDSQADPKLHPTRKNLETQIREFLAEIEPGDTLLVTFAGHGGTTGNISYLCPRDFDGKAVATTCYSTDELRTQLHNCKASQKLLLIDSCHSGGANQIEAIAASSEEVGTAFEKARGLMTLASCRKNETSLYFNSYGVFSYVFALGLSGAADYDKNGIVDSDEIYRYALQEVPITADECWAGHKQTPVRIIGDDVVGVFAMSRPNGPQIPDVRPVRPKAGDISVNSIGMKFAFVPPGAFPMGSPEKEYRRGDDEPPLHAVNISSKLFMGVHEVTQGEYERVMGSNPSFYSRAGGGSDLVAGLKTDRFPVEQVSWEEAEEFCRRLSQLPEEKLVQRVYRLPTEAEWEYSCRANTLTTFHVGDLLSSKQANIRGDRPYLDSPTGPTLGRPTTVGSYPPNAFGLCDMHGNVSEWVSDWYTNRVFASLGFIDLKQLAEQSPQEADRAKFLKLAGGIVNPIGPSTGTTKVVRGGAFQGEVAFARSAARRAYAPDYKYRANGFRVVFTYGTAKEEK